MEGLTNELIEKINKIKNSNSTEDLTQDDLLSLFLASLLEEEKND